VRLFPPVIAAAVIHARLLSVLYLSNRIRRRVLHKPALPPRCVAFPAKNVRRLTCLRLQVRTAVACEPAKLAVPEFVLSPPEDQPPLRASPCDWEQGDLRIFPCEFATRSSLEITARAASSAKDAAIKGFSVRMRR